MNKKASHVFYPKYQLCYRGLRPGKVFTFWDQRRDHFSTEIPFFSLDITDTQKAVLGWLYNKGTPPAISIYHEELVSPDREAFRDPKDLHRHFSPYAMAVVTVQCLGEMTARTLKVYFCKIEVHEAATILYGAIHSKTEGTYIVQI